MMERFQSYFEKLERLSTEELDVSAEKLVRSEARYRCEYRGRDGTRCTSRTGLEIEHGRPFAIFRSHEERYLRAFCERHNRLRAEEVYGAELVQRKIQETRARKGLDK